MKLKFISLIPLLLLISCAPPKFIAQTGTQPSADGTTPLSEREAVAKKPIIKAPQVKAWEISGALAARGNAKSVSASFNWVQRGAHSYQIRMFGPLGSGTVIINRNGGKTTYRDGPKVFTDSSPDRLFRKHTGVTLPVNNLYYWVRGLPAPGSVQSAKRDAQNNLVVLKQAGYTIEYQGYMDTHGARLPRKIRLVGPDVLIKVVIKRWNI